jgi:predicted nuclease of predicted toxin-antitoxin system
LRFLIDECLHPSLTEVCHAAGHEAHHVNFLGLASTKDHDLIPRILQGDFVFVTHNAADFRRLYGAQSLHACLVILVPQSPPEQQRALMSALMEDIRENGDPMNQAIEILLKDGEVLFRRYAWPPI